MGQATADSGTQTAPAEAPAPTGESNQETPTTPEAGNEGQGGSGEAEPAAPSIDDRVASVSGIDDYEAMMVEVASNPSAFANPTEDQHPDDQQQSTPEGEAEPAPPEGDEAEEEAQAPAEDAEEVEGAEDEEVTAEEETPEQEEPEDGKPPQFRLRPTEKLDAEALRIMKAAEAAQSPVTLTEALAIAKQRMGIVDPAPSPESTQDDGNQGDDADDPTEGVTMTEAKQELKDLRKAHSQALRDGDLDEAADVMDRIGETEDLIELIGERDQRADRDSREQHDNAFQASVVKATDLFPDFGDQKSEFYARCTEIDEALRDTQDPRYFDADKPVLIAQMAARELNVAPKAKGRASKTVAKPTAPAPAAEKAPESQTPQQASASPQPPRTEKPGQLPAASGASRTSGAPTGAAASLQQQVEAISTTEDFEKLASQVHAANR